jgi:Holliday junction resolvasome RuvABC endonuclease subunit
MQDLYTDNCSTFTILGIDPGTTTLGYAVYHIGIQDLDIHNAFAWTVDSTRLAFFREDIIVTHGEKFARILAHKQNLKLILERYDPLMVTCETPFFNRLRPSAGGPLFELYGTVEQTVFEWDQTKPLYKAEPKSTKVAVGAAHNAKKPEMLAALKKIKELSMVNFDFLDEHAVDALAVGYNRLTKLRERMRNET